ncbi:MAG: hypothetical protein ABIJ39_13470 [Chloroflexota bacterium]
MIQTTIHPDFLDLQSGTYLIYLSYHDSVIRYMSLDGSRHGQVIDLVQNGFSVSALWTRATFREVDGQPTVFITHSERLSDSETVMRIGLFTGETRTFQIVPQPDVDYCVTHTGYVSRDGRWLAADCAWQGKHYIYIVDFESGDGMGFSPRGYDYECRDPVEGHRNWEFIWDPENRLLSWCSTGFNRAIECLITPQGGNYQCQAGDFDRVLSWSPDGSMVAFFQDLQSPTESYYYLDDAACLQNRQTCGEKVRICDSPNWDSCYFAWDGSGENLAIIGVSSSNLQDFYTNVYLFNIDDGSTETLFVGQPGFWQLLGFSPDNRWVVFDLSDIALFSLDSHLLRRTPTVGEFLGWYIVP